MRINEYQTDNITNEGEEELASKATAEYLELVASAAEQDKE